MCICVCLYVYVVCMCISMDACIYGCVYFKLCNVLFAFIPWNIWGHASRRVINARQCLPRAHYGTLPPFPRSLNFEIWQVFCQRKNVPISLKYCEEVASLTSNWDHVFLKQNTIYKHKDDIFYQKIQVLWRISKKLKGQYWFAFSYLNSEFSCLLYSVVFIVLLSPSFRLLDFTKKFNSTFYEVPMFIRHLRLNTFLSKNLEILIVTNIEIPKRKVLFSLR